MALASESDSPSSSPALEALPPTNARNLAWRTPSTQSHAGVRTGSIVPTRHPAAYMAWDCTTSLGTAASGVAWDVALIHSSSAIAAPVKLEWMSSLLVAGYVKRGTASRRS